MKIFYVLILLFTLMFLSSCQSTNIGEPQNALVVNVKSDDCQITDKFINYGNDTIGVVYLFWAENGSMDILIHNRLKQPIYIDWRKSSYIVGTTKNDYWNETINIESSGDVSGATNNYSQSNESISGTENTTTNNYPLLNTSTTNTNIFLKSLIRSFSNSYSRSSFNSITSITKPERITFIPPGATISMSKYSIIPGNIFNISQTNSYTIDTTLLFNGFYEDIGNNIFRYNDSTTTKKVQLSCINYDKDSSPYFFRSFLTYSTYENFTKEFYIDNSFYVSRITIMPINIFENARKTDEDPNKEHYNIWAEPNSFYIK